MPQGVLCQSGRCLAPHLGLCSLPPQPVCHWDAVLAAGGGAAAGVCGWHVIQCDRMKAPVQ
eukprot:scaffold297398_cov22-Tisochrysis_lutea.AAC.1